jgi:copper chaperone
VIKLKVDGMSCEHCVRTVHQALEQVTGVERVAEVSLERGEAVIEGEPLVSALIEAVEDEGYQAEPTQ